MDMCGRPWQMLMNVHGRCPWWVMVDDDKFSTISYRDMQIPLTTSITVANDAGREAELCDTVGHICRGDLVGRVPNFRLGC